MTYVEWLMEGTMSNYDIDRRFAEFNRLYFSGQLPTVPLAMTPLKSLGGRVKWQTRGGMLVPDSIRLDLSTFWETTHEQLDAILLHEMIHLEFVVAGDMLENHGPKFMARLRRLEGQSGMKIPVTETRGEPAMSPSSIKEICVLLVEDYRADKPPTYSTISCAAALAIAEEMKTRWSGRAQWQRPGITVTLYRIKTPIWTRMAAKTTVARGEPKKLYFLKDEVSMSDLRANGQMIWRVTTNELK